MIVEEAIEYAKTMSYTDAVYNALQGRAVPYKKATKIKLDELLKIAKELDKEERMTFEDKAEIVINQLRADRDRLQNLVDNHIDELEKIKEEIQGLIDFEESCCGNTTLGYECLGVVNKSIEAYYHTLKQAEEEELELDQRE